MQIRIDTNLCKTRCLLDTLQLKTCGATRNPEFPRTGSDRTETGPGSGNIFKNIFGPGRVGEFYFGSVRVGEFYFGSVRVGVFFTGVWDIFSRDFGDKLPFHSQTEEVAVIILDKHVVLCYNFIAGQYSRVYCSLKLELKLKSLISTQNIFHTSEFSGRSGSKLVNFGLMLNCFGPVRSGENIIGSVRGRGHKIYYFSVRSGSEQKITGQYGIGVPKTLPRRTLIATRLHLTSVNLNLTTGAPLSPSLCPNGTTLLKLYSCVTREVANCIQKSQAPKTAIIKPLAYNALS